MKSIASEVNFQIEVKKSKFICYIKNVDNEKQAIEYIDEIKKLHPQATHHCYGYSVGNAERAYDDGEPSQTAGMPILNVLMHNELINTIAIVVRYFGGTKLGAGGLVRAYTESVVKTLEVCQINDIVKGVILTITCGYSNIDKINYILKQNTVINYEISYDQKVVYTLKTSNIKYEVIKNQILTYDHTIKIVKINDILVVNDNIV